MQNISRLGTVSGVVAILSLSLSIKSANAQTVFDSFGPGDTFDTSIAYLIDPIGSLGFMFTPSFSGPLSSISIALSDNSSVVNSVDVFLTDSSAPGTLPNTLESWSLAGLPNYSVAYTPSLLASVAHPILTAGTTYTLYAKSTGDMTWNRNTLGMTGNYVFSSNGTNFGAGSGLAQGAFRVNLASSSAPEPGTLALLAIGGTIGVLRRRRK
jgi:hypothetical protein